MIMLGMTGTQTPSDAAWEILTKHFAKYDPLNTTLVHGCCIGMDTRAAIVARDMGFTVLGIVPANEYKVSPIALECSHMLIRMPKGTSFMDRNDKLISIVHELVGFPKTGHEELRSGTWATIRRGWKKFGKNAVDIIPVGSA